MKTQSNRTSSKRSAMSRGASSPKAAGMDVYEKLKSDHRKVEKLFKQILKTEDDELDERQELFQELFENLEAHAEAEEKIFYPRTEEAEKTHDLTLEAYEEHKIAKTLLSEIQALDPSDDVWMAKVKVLSEMINHHVEEEENELFPKSKKVIEKDRAKEMAGEIEQSEMETIAELQKSA